MPLPPRPPPKPKPGAGPSAETILDRKRGALMGLAVGDALGATHEFKQVMAPGFPTLMEGHKEIVGGGPFGVKPGQVTDDTQMAICLATSLRTAKAFSAEDVIARYRSWASVAFDIGAQTKEVLTHQLQNWPYDASKAVWLKSQKRAAGNGSLMRTAPIGVFFSKETDARAKASVDDAALTHYDPRCQLACVAFNSAIAHSIHRSEKLTHQQLLGSVSSEIGIGANHFGKRDREFVRDTQDAIEALRKDLKIAGEDDPKLYGPELHIHQMQGFVRVAFRYAFWHFLHQSPFEAALIDIVNRGGDTDTNAAIAGALLGAWYGENAIPSRWRTAVTGALEFG
ncbi:MAG: ADP-ribosylglycohydrolase family protein, partial [Myxococcaceae bacterium]